MSYYDAILHLDSADPARLGLVLRNAANYLKALPDQNFSLEIVANGPAVLILTTLHKNLRQQALPILDSGVKLKVCANALAENGLTQENIWPECIVVPAGLVEIARLQKEGFAYIKP